LSPEAFAPRGSAASVRSPISRRGQVLIRVRALTDVARAWQVFALHVIELKQRWLSVLEATAKAIDDAARIHGLGADEGRDRKNRLRDERAWVEAFDWRAA
jgi:hypothetical protein